MADLDTIRYFVDENTLALGKVMAGLRDDTAVIGLPPIDRLSRTRDEGRRVEAT